MASILVFLIAISFAVTPAMAGPPDGIPSSPKKAFPDGRRRAIETAPRGETDAKQSESKRTPPSDPRRLQKWRESHASPYSRIP